MSKKYTCSICGQAEEGDCQLMTVVIDEDGKETKVCCQHLYSEKSKDK